MSLALNNWAQVFVEIPVGHANSVDPNQSPLSDPGLHRLPITHFFFFFFFFWGGGGGGWRGGGWWSQD